MGTDLVEEDLDRYKYLGNVGAWPRLPSDINPLGWLGNFSDDERPLAAALLRSLVYINDREFRQAIASSIKLLAFPEVAAGRESSDITSRWKDRLARMVITVPLGSEDDPTSSGYMCLRYVKELGFPEERILVGKSLYAYIEAAAGSIELVLIDDLAASGNQFVRYWKASPTIDGAVRPSPQQLVQSGAVSAASYLPVVATQTAIDNFVENAPEVAVRPTHLLGPEYSLYSDDCSIVPEDQIESLRRIAETHYPRTGADNGPFGFKNTGLALSFSHGTPNNTLPILAGRPKGYEGQDWTYLRSI